MDLSKRLKEFFYMKKLENITASQIANQLGISKKTLSNYINGERYIPIEHLNSICNLFDISLDYLLGFNSLKQYPNSKTIITLDKNLIGKRLKEFRKENKLTQEKIANIIGTGKSTICKYENGSNMILTIALYTICYKYHLSADYLIGKIDEPKYINE